jgi:hypothetical protein
MHKLISTDKQHKMTFPRFNLPAKLTCPGSTEFCRSKCYACKAERIWPAVLPYRTRNFEASKSSSFVNDICIELEKIQSSKKATKFFRLHESGDFYSQAYLDKWSAIAKIFPSVKFLAFTKSFHLDFSRIPANLKIVYSVMQDTSVPVPEGPKAYAGLTVEGSFECVGHCDNCVKCWSLKPSKSVYFSIH